MSGNNEDGEGQVCSGCLDYIRSIPSSIRNLPFRRYFLALLVKSDDHFVGTVIILISSILIIVTWFEFREIEISFIVFAYCFALIICSFLTFIEPKGYLNEKYRKASRQERRQQIRVRQGARQVRQGARQGRQGSRQRIQHQPEGAVPPAGFLGNEVEQGRAAAPECRHVQEAPFDFHHAEEPSESSNSVEPESTSSDEPLQQAAPFDLGSNLPILSTDPSTQSTHSTPLDDVVNEEPQKDEPLQPAAPSDSDSNLPRSSTDPSTQSTHSTPLDDHK